jgi:hypothetical protein|tara:strand:+ start:260 stop:697 length:438 start_codon:yes stop_codon:yes gene_type:complete
MITATTKDQNFSGKVHELTRERVEIGQTIRQLESELSNIDQAVWSDMTTTRIFNLAKRLGGIESVLLSTMMEIQHLIDSANLIDWIDDTEDNHYVLQEIKALKEYGMDINGIQIDAQKVEGKLNRKISNPDTDQWVLEHGVWSRV